MPNRKVTLTPKPYTLRHAHCCSTPTSSWGSWEPNRRLPEVEDPAGEEPEKVATLLGSWLLTTPGSGVWCGPGPGAGAGSPDSWLMAPGGIGGASAPSAGLQAQLSDWGS